MAQRGKGPWYIGPGVARRIWLVLGPLWIVLGSFYLIDPSSRFQAALGVFEVLLGLAILAMVLHSRRLDRLAAATTGVRNE